MSKETDIRKKLASRSKRIVIKLGTRILTGSDNLLEKPQIKQLVLQVCELVKRKIEVVLVSSGAVGAGMGVLQMKSRPGLLPKLQATAAIGQSQLMKVYDSFFRLKEIISAQILLTAEDLNNRTRYLNVRNTLSTLFRYRVIPIINENDSVSVDEIKFGDNDTLASLVTTLIDADLLIILSDINGLYVDRDSPNKIVSMVESISPRIEKLAASSAPAPGVGGMKTKLQAAKTVTSSGIPMIIANGRSKDVLLRIFNGDRTGTLFLAVKDKMVARKRWIAYSAISRGEIKVDNGAREALVQRGKSLLASGIVEVKGNFKTGDIVKILNEQGREFARGVVNYSREELSKIKGLKTSQIKSRLGCKFYDEAVHRDNLVIL
jgi:glutamate 5-kinase